MPSPLTVAEVFGPTVQGEGPSAGRRCAFVRLGRCNLTCSWCDTPYTWDWSGRNGQRYDPAVELAEVPSDAVADQVRKMNVDRVVFTGGEPMLQAQRLKPMMVELGLDHTIEVETNGTLGARGLVGVVDQFNVSPKLTNSGVDPRKAIRLEHLAEFAVLPRTAFKFVVVDVGDLHEIDALVRDVPIMRSQVWVMPEGRQAEVLEERLGTIADAAIGRGYNVTSRLHVLAWGDERGR